MGTRLALHLYSRHFLVFSPSLEFFKDFSLFPAQGACPFMFILIILKDKAARKAAKKQGIVALPS